MVCNCVNGKKYHQIIKDCHLDFINAGAEIILTNTFGSRRRRLEDNQIENRFEELNFTALKLARIQVKKSGKKSANCWQFASTKLYLPS